MSEVIGVVVGHARLADGLVRAVDAIAGAGDALRPISNSGCTPQELRRRVERAAGPGPAVLFVDMASGSCAFAGLQVISERSEVAVVTGVNLPMLLDFVFHRDLEPAELAERARRRGRGAIRVHLGPESPGEPAVERPDVDRADSR